MKIILVCFCLIGLGFLLIWYGSARQKRATTRLIEGLERAGPGGRIPRVRFESLRALPAPVERYFRLTLKDGQPFIRVARFSQKGKLRISEKSDRWFPFDANQIGAPLAPGFIWNARVWVAPLAHVRVLDGYIRGKGSGQVRLLSAITLAEEEGGAELNSGALYRYLAEAVWYPTALLPDSGVRWTPIDDKKALASLTDEGVTVSLEFRFNDAGEVIGIYTPGRYGKFDGGYKLTPWEGHFRRYEEKDDMRAPMEGEVGWYRSGVWQPVWKGRIVDLRYEFTND